jgi:hypothetical protein
MVYNKGQLGSNIRKYAGGSARLRTLRLFYNKCKGIVKCVLIRAQQALAKCVEHNDTYFYHVLEKSLWANTKFLGHYRS